MNNFKRHLSLQFLFCIMAGILSALFLYFAYPPHEIYPLCLVSLVIQYLVAQGRHDLFHKIASFVTFKVCFLLLFHQYNDWLLIIATKSHPEYFYLFKLSAIIQYGFGSIITYIIGIGLFKFIPLERLRHPLLRSVLKNCSLSFIFSLTIYFTTSNHEVSFLTPLIVSRIIKTLSLPYYLFHFFSFFSIFFIIDLAKSKQYFQAGAAAAVFMSFIFIQNNITDTVPLIKNRFILVPSKSLYLTNQRKQIIKKHLLSLKGNLKIKGDHVYIWPEASFSFKDSDTESIPLTLKLISEHYPGIHFIGLYSVKTSEDGKSTNRYLKFETYSQKLSFIDKAFPVPFQEDSNYFWFINQKKIELSFNVKRTENFQSLNIYGKKVGIYLCNEIADVKNILGQFDSNLFYLFVPSNPPIQNTTYYDQLINFYAVHLSKVTGKSIVKVSSNQSLLIKDVLKEGRVFKNIQMGEIHL